MKKLLIFIVLIFISSHLISQIYPREFNTNYMYTVFNDDFIGTEINLNNWESNLTHRGIGELIDSSLTHSVSGGKLGLTMAYVPNYNDSSDFVGGEFWTKKTYLYGSFECKASFAKQLGSWPAFWSFHRLPCPNNEGPEIDFAEYFCKVLNGPVTIRTLGHYIHHWLNAPCGETGDETGTDYNYTYGFTSSTNTFKCIWTPEKIEFYVDNVKKVTYYNNGIDWYPAKPVSVILSQQILQPYTIIGQPISPVYPQTSYFDYVKVKKFFLAPEITCPDFICSSGTAFLDVDDEAENITWQLSPSNFFSTVSGSGLSANISPWSGASGLGTITFSFEMPSGESFETGKSFWVGQLPTPVITGPATVKCGYDVTFSVDATNAENGDSFYWDSNVVSIISGRYSPQCTVSGTDPAMGGYISCRVTACGVDKTGSQNINVIGCPFLLLSPNPATSETLVSIENASEEERLGESAEWDLEVLDQNQMLKMKKTRLKVSTYTLNTTGWHEGLYLVRANYKGELLTEKLMVKK